MDRGNRITTLSVRVYGQGLTVTESHSYLVDDHPAGLSAAIGQVPIDARKLNFTKLRLILQYNTSEHMNRRSLLFQEALYIMSRLPNVYNRPKHELTKWQFGYVRKDNDQVKLIHPDKEEQVVYSVIPELYNHDLVIVPLSQIPPEYETSSVNTMSEKAENNDEDEIAEVEN